MLDRDIFNLLKNCQIVWFIKNTVKIQFTSCVEVQRQQLRTRTNDLIQNKSLLIQRAQLVAAKTESKNQHFRFPDLV
jgi:hypothetical protein